MKTNKANKKEARHTNECTEANDKIASTHGDLCICETSTNVESAETERSEGHTPTPWKAYKRDVYEGENVVAACGNNENATYIVHAVNSHEALLEALKREHENVHDWNVEDMDNLGCNVCKTINQAEGK